MVPSSYDFNSSIAEHLHTQDEGSATSISQAHDTVIVQGKISITNNPHLMRVV